MIKGLVSTGRGAAVAKHESATQLTTYELLLEQRFLQAQEDGDLPRDSDAGMLAQMLKTTALGLAVRADAGATSAVLHRIADSTLRALFLD
jgi:hypothetical protein